jgi:hypothetical protein
MLRTGVKGRRRSLIVLSSVLAAAVVAAFVLVSHHKGPLATSPVTQTPLATQSPLAAPPQPPVDAQPVLDPTFLVLASMGTTPPGARIVRISDGKVLGYTPETLEFHQSNQPEMVRFELQGYAPVTREVPAVSDSVFRIVLEPLPTKHSHGFRKRSN